MYSVSARIVPLVVFASFGDYKLVVSYLTYSLQITDSNSWGQAFRVPSISETQGYEMLHKYKITERYVVCYRMPTHEKTCLLKKYTNAPLSYISMTPRRTDILSLGITEIKQSTKKHLRHKLESKLTAVHLFRNNGKYILYSDKFTGSGHMGIGLMRIACQPARHVDERGVLFRNHQVVHNAKTDSQFNCHGNSCCSVRLTLTLKSALIYDADPRQRRLTITTVILCTSETI